MCTELELVGFDLPTAKMELCDGRNLNEGFLN